LETAQFCLIFITKDWSLLKKLIQGQKDQKRPMKAKKGHQRPELQKIIDFMDI
jgi:transcriptional regulator GlxA family with amidase domain